MGSGVLQLGSLHALPAPLRPEPAAWGQGDAVVRLDSTHCVERCSDAGWAAPHDTIQLQACLTVLLVACGRLHYSAHGWRRRDDFCRCICCVEMPEPNPLKLRTQHSGKAGCCCSSFFSSREGHSKACKTLVRAHKACL